MSVMAGSVSLVDWIRAMDEPRKLDRDEEVWIKVPDKEFRRALINHIAEIEDRLKWIDERLENAERRNEERQAGGE
jgi:hypothetical protein